MELDNYLKQLALQAKQYPPYSDERRQALSRLSHIIEKLKLLKPKKGYNRELYEEAKQALWLYIYEHIEKYNPDKGTIIAWLSYLLHKRYYPEVKAIEAKEIEIVKEIAKWLGISITPSHYQILLVELKELIALDPDGIFRLKHVKNHPQANFQTLTQLYYFEGYSWEEISQKLGIKATTLNSFYWRCFQHFKLKLQQYLTD